MIDSPMRLSPIRATGVARLKKIGVLESWVQGQLQPDITLYLDVDPDIAEQRIAAREKDRMEVEQRDFLFAYVKGIWIERASINVSRSSMREFSARSAG